ncbi:MAG: hypothetical protein KAR47_16100, partial [Planctomycetes bacterium]|nr:hypothetical protein [Planctomycetota bacterium]
VSGKDITITGTAPEKPEIVAQTVINCSGGHRGFTLLGTGQGSCTLRGLTIVNAGGGGSKIPSTPNRPGGTDGLDAGLNMGAGVYVSGPHIVADCVIRSCYVGGTEGQDGTNGQYPPGNPGHEAHGGSGGKGGTVAGGGIYVSWGSAQILRCTIDGCLIRGGRGADGSNGASGSDDDMRYISWGGTGGYGGGAYGGGICIDQWARGVLIEDSTITNCRAVGGVGGNGGNGGNRADGGDAGAPGPAFGGGIYVAQGADVSIEGTSMEGCEAVGGLGGDGGERDGAAWPGFGGGTPYDPLQGDPTQYTAKGGGLYYEDYSTATIRDCTFSGNIVRGSVTGVGELFAGGHREEPQKNYQLPGYGAGMFVGDYSHVTVTNCSFSDNLADLNPNPGDESAPVFLEYFIEGYIGYGGGVCFEGIS